MADGFTAAEYVTDIRLSEVQGKRLWLVRVPRHIDPARLEVSITTAAKHHSLRVWSVLATNEYCHSHCYCYGSS